MGDFLRCFFAPDLGSKLVLRGGSSSSSSESDCVVCLASRVSVFLAVVGQGEVSCFSDEGVALALPLPPRTLSGDGMLPFVFELSGIFFPAMRGRITASACLRCSRALPKLPFYLTEDIFYPPKTVKALLLAFRV